MQILSCLVVHQSFSGITLPTNSDTLYLATVGRRYWTWCSPRTLELFVDSGGAKGFHCSGHIFQRHFRLGVEPVANLDWTFHSHPRMIGIVLEARGTRKNLSGSLNCHVSCFFFFYSCDCFSAAFLYPPVATVASRFRSSDIIIDRMLWSQTPQSTDEMVLTSDPRDYSVLKFSSGMWGAQ